MRELHESHSIIEAAEQAAAAGNYISAEELLRKAALAQEARLGPIHPDLANTMNNLGIVCEINGKPADAEQCFRRAFSIATRALGPDHPLVATSLKNLREFCEARGKKLESPPSPPEASQQRQPDVRTRSVRPLVIGAFGPVAMLIVILAVQPWLSSTGRHDASPAVAIESAPAAPVMPRASLPVEPAPAPATTHTTKTAERNETAHDSQITRPAVPVRPTVARARLCAELVDWSCDPPDRPIPPGPLFFYTQVKSTGATTLQHRWYRGDRLQQSVDFHVEPSSKVGYRVFSRYTMKDDSAGTWRVELRTKDGLLLHEERFLVQ
jgi:hypothetical protein